MLYKTHNSNYTISCYIKHITVYLQTFSPTTVAHGITPTGEKYMFMFYKENKFSSQLVPMKIPIPSNSFVFLYYFNIQLITVKFNCNYFDTDGIQCKTKM